MTVHDSITAPTPDRIFEVGFGFWASRALLSAVELGLFTELARGPATGGELAERLGLHGRGARDLFDALVALGLVDRRGGRYRNAADAELFLDRAKPSYAGGILEMSAERLWPAWGRLTRALRTGAPQNVEADLGGDIFDSVYADPERLRSFLGGMTGTSMPAALGISRLLPWAKIGSFADIGCAEGGFAAVVAGAHPHLTGVGFDLPQVGPHFEAFVAAKGLAGRLTFQAGDFFADPLPEAEVLVMGHILHDWDLEKKRQLIAKAHAALPVGGRLVVYEMLIDDARERNVMGLLMSLNMLVETRGGFDFTGADCMGWMLEAGFHSASVHPLAGPYSAVVAIR